MPTFEQQIASGLRKAPKAAAVGFLVTFASAGVGAAWTTFICAVGMAPVPLGILAGIFGAGFLLSFPAIALGLLLFGVPFDLRLRRVGASAAAYGWAGATVAIGVWLPLHLWFLVDVPMVPQLLIAAIVLPYGPITGLTYWYFVRAVRRPAPAAAADCAAMQPKSERR